MTDWKNEIKNILSGDMEFHISASELTTYQIGGIVEAVIHPRNPRELISVLDILKKGQIPFFILGAGSNILVSDDGFPGVFISLMRYFDYLQFEDDLVTVGAGRLVMNLIEECERKGLSGIERLYGIPGTMGGAIKMNIRAYDCEIGEFVESVQVLREGKIQTLDRRDLGFRYRDSNIGDDDVVLDVKLRLNKGIPAEIRETRQRILNIRQMKQPLDWGSCGSTFKNPAGGKSAGQLIEEAGLKGLQYGKARISPVHANFFLNLGNASANDIIHLIKLTRKTVLEHAGVLLEPEVKLVGFPEDILE